MMRLISWSSLVCTQTGSSPSVVPLLGSEPINGTGMKGAVEGLNHRVSGLGGTLGSAPPASGGGTSSAAQCVHPSAVSRLAAMAQQRDERTSATQLGEAPH